MQVFRIEVIPNGDHSENRFIDAAQQLGIKGVEACLVTRLFFLEGDISPTDADKIAAHLLGDPVTERCYRGVSDLPDGAQWVEVTLHPGVTDPIAENLVRAAHLLGIDGLRRAATGQRYIVQGDLSTAELHRLATEVFSNPVIQSYVEGEAIAPPFVPYQEKDDTVETIAIREADDTGLMAISQERRLSLDINEMRAIRDYYLEIARDPTDTELEMLAQTWSEHCVHKTFKANITYTGPVVGAAPDSPPTQQRIAGILNTYIRAATEEVNKPWVRSAFVDNAGIVAFTEGWDLAFKVETHNRPSALEPFGGANTGSGGVIRDVLGVSARPIANTDILCFGPPDMPYEALPQGVLHPQRIAEGVIHGIEDYGNKMGIPTVNGAVFYHPGYTSNPLVFCGCLGILPTGSHPTAVQPGDLIVVVGGHTGRDGLRGATFSSMEMDISTATLSGGAVQIGHPINEKQVQEVVLRARDEKLYTAITDCGAGGLSSAVGEMGEKIGARVQLADVPLKYPGLRPWEIWLSEAQERMVLAVSPENWPRLQTICAGQDVSATVIGTFEPSGQLQLYYGEKLVGDISMHFLHDGIPTREMTAEWLPPAHTSEFTYKVDEDFGDTLLKLLALPTIRSKEDVVRRYDHEVQTGTAVKPLVGVGASGPGDATVLVPLDVLSSSPTGGEGFPIRAVALSNGLCPQYTAYDPYAMAWAAIDEAMRNLVAVGADPDQVAILDNFSWGNAQIPDRLGALVRCSQGCYDAAVAYETPFVSGKDSLNNEYLGGDGQRHAIPGTLVISAMGIVPDVDKTVTMDLKTAGNELYVIGGPSRDEFGGSHYNLLHGIDGGSVPQPNPAALKVFRALHRAIQAGLVQSCHDLSEGGLAVALAEMCIAGGLGAEMTDYDFSDLGEESDVTRQRRILFAESNTRFIVEVRPEDALAFQEMLDGFTWDGLGSVTEAPELVLGTFGARDKAYRVSLADLESAFRGHLPQAEPISNNGTAPNKTTEGPTSTRSPSTRSGSPKVLILHANGTNRDRDAYLACELAGGAPEIVHVNQIIAGERDLLDYHMLVVPGGFSYGDDLGAGVLWALDLRERLQHIDRFVADGRPVLGICNGFQTLVKSGLLPGDAWSNGADLTERPVTLTYNQRGRFECRWVYLQPDSASPCLFTDGLTDLIHCPVAHGEGQVAVRDDETLARLDDAHLIALRYVDQDGEPTAYPLNPNGSVGNIAGLSSPEGNVFGLMPHPENHIFPWQHPRNHRGENGRSGLVLFQNGIRFA